MHANSVTDPTMKPALEPVQLSIPTSTALCAAAGDHAAMIAVANAALASAVAVGIRIMVEPSLLRRGQSTATGRGRKRERLPCKRGVGGVVITGPPRSGETR